MNNRRSAFRWCATLAFCLTLLSVARATDTPLSALASLARLQNIVANAGAPAQEVVLSPYAGPLRTITARVAGKDRTFLFDTGGGGSLLSTKLVAETGYKPFGRVTAFRHDGGRMDLQRVGPTELTIGAFSRRDEFAVIDLDELLRGLPPIDGILSLETFAGRIITLDLGANRLWIETPESARARTTDAKELKARFSRTAGGAGLDIFVAIEGQNGPLWFELDSGSAAPVLIAPHAASELGIQNFNGAGPKRVTLNVDGLGPAEYEAQSKDMIYDGLLNAAFCARYVITFDLAGGRVWVKPGESKK